MNIGISTVIPTAALFCVLTQISFAMPLKVFILAGQSNMQGHVDTSTFDYIGTDPFKRVCLEYDEKAGYELAGFVWFQVFNDMVDSQTYPNGNFDEYSRLLPHFIRDVRKDLSAPKMPFVTGVLGVEGITKADKQKLDLALEEVFSPKGKDALEGASNGGYHYFGSAKIFAQMAKAFAEAIANLQK